MGLKITRGLRPHAVRVVIYGDEGIGKTTLATQFPNPVVLDTEDGTHHLDCARVAINDCLELEGAIHELARDPQGFQTVVVDSADWAERIVIEMVVRRAGKKSIEDFGFGKGYVVVCEQFSKLLSAADALIAKGINVVFVAHSKVVRTSPPDETDGYDRYELKLSKQVAPLLREWADCVLFCNYKTKLVEGADGRTKAKGGTERLMYASHTAAFDAKNRYGLPDVMPMAFDSIKGIFGPAALQARGAARAGCEAEPAASTKQAALQAIAAANTVERVKTLSKAIDERRNAGTLDDNEWGELQSAIDARLAALTAGGGNDGE
jgi:hypothetical protein